MDDSFGEYSSNRPYTSCMKMNGVPLLPPLMTPEYRQEMQYYKQLAMSVENRMYEMKMCLDETTINSNILPSDSEEWFDEMNVSTMSSKTNNRDLLKQHTKETYIDELNFINNRFENNEFESMNSIVTVIDNDVESSFNSSVVQEPEHSIDSFEQTTANYSELDISSDSKNLTSQSETWNESNGKIRNQPFSNQTQKLDNNSDTKNKIQTSATKIKSNISEKRKISTRKDVVPKNDVSKVSQSTKTKRNVSNRKENISPVITSFIKSNKKNNLSEKVAKKNCQKSSIKLSPSKNVTGSLNNISSGLATPPKLMRQNSYTLEHPSPLLLAHLEEQSLASGIDLPSISMSESTSTSFLYNSSKNKSWDSITAKETWSSIGSDINSISINENFDPTSGNKSSLQNHDCIITPVKASNQVKNEKNSLGKDISNTPILESKRASTSGFESLSKNASNNLSKKYESENRVSLDIPDVLSDCDKSNNKIIHSSPGVSYYKSMIHSNEDLNTILKKFQEEHDARLAELVKKQEEEQLLLKKSFEKQQELILARLQSVKILKDIVPEETNTIKTNLNSVIPTENNNKDVTEKKAESINNCSHSENKSNEQDDAIVDIININHARTDAQKIDKNTNSYLDGFGDQRLLDLSKISKDYYNESQLDESIITERTSNTLDDIHFTFANDDTSNSHNNSSDSQIFNCKDKDIENMSKLKSALDKITKIQQNLASQPTYRSPNVEKHPYLDNKYSTNDNQIISLSSINDIKPIYFDSDTQHSTLDRNMLSLNLTEVHRPRIDRKSRKTYVLKPAQYSYREIQAATIIVAYAKGYLTRRLMRTERVESTVQTIRDTLMCALQLHRDEGGIQGADIDLHRRLIQQITAACYSLHDMFIVFTPTERMSIISQDRDRKISLSHRSVSSGSSMRQLSATTQKILRRKLDSMSKSHSGVFTTRSRTNNIGIMTRSHHEQNYHIRGMSDKPRRSVAVASDFVSRKPWR